MIARKIILTKMHFTSTLSFKVDNARLLATVATVAEISPTELLQLVGFIRSHSKNGLQE